MGLLAYPNPGFNVWNNTLTLGRWTHQSIQNQTEANEKALYDALLTLERFQVQSRHPRPTYYCCLWLARRRSSFTVRLFWQMIGCPESAPALLRMNNDAALCSAQSGSSAALSGSFTPRRRWTLAFSHKPHVGPAPLNSQFCCRRGAGGTHPKVNSAQGLTGRAPQGHGSASLSSKTFEKK